jgi:peptidoglycan/LPS O-acetylase OafA/YrhL
MSILPAVPDDRSSFLRLDSLRGLAALAVAGYHFGGCGPHGVALLPTAAWPGADPLQNAVRRVGVVVLSSHAAVLLFFVLSGFVLRLSLARGPRAPGAASARFFLARVFRLYPITLAGVLLAVLAAPAGLPPAREVVANALLLSASLNGVLWSLQVEMLMVPFLLALYFLERRRGPGLLAAVAVVTSALAFKPGWAVWPPLSTNFFAFVLGMLVPTVGRRLAAGRTGRGAALALALAAAAFLLPNPCFGRYSKFSTVTEGYAAFVLVSLAAYRPDLRALRWLDWRPLRLLGTASGSYYVLHMATVPVATAVAAALVPAAWSASAPAFVGVSVLAAWLLALAPLTVGTYYLVEAPGVALGRRAVKWLRLDAKPAPAAVPGAAPREEAPRRAA